jgi:hypothetical protein
LSGTLSMADGSWLMADELTQVMAAPNIGSKPSRPLVRTRHVVAELN